MSMIKENIEKMLVFDVWSDYAHFRKIYTTTSPLTFSIPPRTALCGLFGAIIGLEKENNEYLNYFTLDRAKTGLKILNPIKKVRISENIIHTKNAKGIGMNLITERTQINFEFLKNPKYRIYLWHNDDELYGALKKYLSEHKPVYTPCLGLSENIANFKFVGEFDTYLRKHNSSILIHSIIPTQKLVDDQGVEIASEMEYFSERIPVEMDTKRIVTKYSDILFERNGKPIKAKMKESYLEVNYNDGTKENIVFIE